MAFTAVLTLSALLTGCSNDGQVHIEPESSSADQVETVPSFEAGSYSESEISESDDVSEESNSGTVSEALAFSGTEPESQIVESKSNEEENSEMKMNVNVNGRDFTATLEQNSAVDALVQMMESGPITIQLSDYSGFEKVGPLGQNLPTSNSQTTAHAGDIVLYQGNQIVMFYGSNSWSYTRLGHIDDLTDWEEALGSGNVTVIFSMED